MSVVTVNSENFQKEVLQAELAVVDFWASWCGPCKMFGPIFEEVAGQMEGVTFAKLNVDDVPDLASQYKVMSIPTVILFKNGQAVRKSLGVISAAELKELSLIHISGQYMLFGGRSPVFRRHAFPSEHWPHGSAGQRRRADEAIAPKTLRAGEGICGLSRAWAEHIAGAGSAE